ncbi:molybdopterin-dependent oxidoreductase [Rhizobium sp. RCAM05973]|uniref:molybdopterin-dependent oxidoreductase n=1 Tax=Rhizobium sp. RCAM05973 TaxID=2994066 RepID=UPI0022EC0C3A|nr:molybdopterin-dependent oxidoreductase [Rhizobium sp. RCAM05973]
MKKQVAGWCALCKSRCGATFTMEDGRLVSAGSLPDHPTGKSLCIKGKAGPEILYSPDRLLYPQKRTNPKSSDDPGWVRITWDEALATIGQRLREIREKHGGEAICFSTTTPSGTAISDGEDWIDRLIRLTTPNWVSTTEVCNWHRDFTHQFTFGSSLPYPDWERTDFVVLWGFNPSSVWLDQATQVAAARARGAKVMVVDPRRFGFAIGADHWLRVRPGTDGILMLAMARHLIETKQYNEDFVRRWSNGALLVRNDTGAFLRGRDISVEAPAEAFVARDEEGTLLLIRRNSAADGELLSKAQISGTTEVDCIDGSVKCRTAFDHYCEAAFARTLEEASAQCWVPVEEIVAAADAFAQARSMAYYTWTGLGQHANASQTDRAFATLMSLKGCYDVPGGNVVLPAHRINKVGGEHLLTADQIAKAIGIKERPLGPPKVGRIVAHDFYTAVLDGLPYTARALVGFGSNLAVAHADSTRGRAALAALDFYVHCDIFENPSARCADILLPVNTFYERDAMRVGFGSGLRAEQHIQYRPALVPSAGESRSDAEIAFAIADQLGLNSQFFEGSIDAGREHILEPLGITYDELKARPGGINIPLEQRYRKYAEVTDGQVTGFKTETGLVELYSHLLKSEGEPPVPRFETGELQGEDPNFPFVLTTAKTVYFCHSQHRNIPSLRKREQDPSVFLSPATATELQLEEGDWADVKTEQSWIRMRVQIDKSLHPRIVRASYGWWQGNQQLNLPSFDAFKAGGANYNMLLNADRLDRLSGTAPHRSLSCNVVPAVQRPARLRGWQGWREMQIVSSQRVADEVTAVHLSPVDGGSLPDYLPGQHITVRYSDAATGEQLIRCYSLTGPASDRNRSHYSIAVRFVPRPGNRPELPDGRMSAVMNRVLKPGDRVEIQVPSGHFIIPEDSDRPVVLVAGGIGITPMLSYLESLAANGSAAPRVHLVYANRNGSSEAFAQRLAELQEILPHLSVQRLWSGHNGNMPPSVGLGHASIADILGNVDKAPRIYFCGPHR